MRRTIAIVAVAVAALGGIVLYNRSGDAAGDPAAGGGGRGGGRGGRPPMPVEFAVAKRAPVSEQILVVGNLIGAATVEVVPRVNGRLQAVNVKLGDAVKQGEVIARVEDLEIREQVRQAEATYKVSEASIRQRKADLALAKNNLDRSRSLYERQLLPQQTFDDVDARYQAALAQLDLAQAQFEVSKARLDELKITLSNTQIVAPVDGFVGKRFLDPGAFASTNAPVASIVDIRTVRMVANLVERDMRRVPTGTPAVVEVDAFPGEKFNGRVSRVAPVFDPATRTAEIEIEVANGDYRLKPGMYSRVQLTISTRDDAITIPRNALVDLEGKSGVFVADVPAGAEGTRGSSGTAGSSQPQALVAKFVPVEVGIRDGEHIEVKGGLNDGTRVITTGASALKDGDRIVAASAGRGQGRQGQGQGQGSAPNPGQGAKPQETSR
ncbi:MAG TPA: efflux RND transporter periplasmic adaptor subunit [Vicinamibacterales bacterium]|nr:efflux RND transporter periplasmic adaptor subunit [Vicinamibacterales bacterium]